MKKILLVLSCLFLLATTEVFADVDKIIKNSPLNKNSIIGVSIQNANNGKTLYQQNSDKLLSPASTLKLFTTVAALDTLGKDYTFDTSVYKKNNNLYIELSGDPYLTSAKLSQILKKSNTTKSILEVDTVYVDDNALDSYNWGIGWMWDDNTNPLMPKFGAYNLNGNLADISVKVINNETINVEQKSKYNFSIVNLLEIGAVNNIVPVSQNGIIYLTGTIATSANVQVPVDNIQRYFLLYLEKALETANIKYNSIAFADTPSDAELLYQNKQAIEPIIFDVLGHSNNLMAETIFKTAGAKYSDSMGTISSALDMFNHYYTTLGNQPNELEIVDGSGVSMNNLVTSRWMTDTLVSLYQKNKFESFKKYIVASNEGTLFNRFGKYDDKLYAKTGTLAGKSALVGYVFTKKNTPVAFCINIQNYRGSSSQAKALENAIVEDIYQNY